MHSTHKNCLNCNTKLHDVFCSHCGQKADTHRISLKNFIFHDVLHGTFHLEKGILFTAKEALVRPGKAALDYIYGKRKRYYNVFYLILITLGLTLFFRHFYKELVIGMGRDYVTNPVELNDASKELDKIISQKSKLLVFLFVPFAALNGLLLFRRKKLNLSEHSIIGGMILLGLLLFNLLGTLLFYFDLISEFNDILANTISISITVLCFLYVAFGYINAFAVDYSRFGMAWRILMFFVLLFIEVWALLFIIVGFVTHWKYGEITITPFG